MCFQENVVPRALRIVRVLEFGLCYVLRSKPLDSFLPHFQVIRVAFPFHTRKVLRSCAHVCLILQCPGLCAVLFVIMINFLFVSNQLAHINGVKHYQNVLINGPTCRPYGVIRWSMDLNLNQLILVVPTRTQQSHFLDDSMAVRPKTWALRQFSVLSTQPYYYLQKNSNGFETVIR